MIIYSSEANATNGLYDRDFDITVTRQGSDYNQFDQRFVPVTDNESQSYMISQASSSLTDRAGEIEYALGSATIENEGKELIEASDDSGGTRTRFTSTVDNTAVSISVTIPVLATGGQRALIYKNGVLWQRGTTVNAASRTSQATTKMVLNDGDYFTVTADAEASNIAEPTVITFEARPVTMKALVGNLNPKHLISTPSAVKPVIYSANIGSTGITGNEIGSFVVGNCTHTTGTYTCDITDGGFSAANCFAIVADASAHFTAQVLVNNPTSFKYEIRDTGTPHALTDRASNIFCHGIQ